MKSDQHEVASCSRKETMVLLAQEVVELIHLQIQEVEYRVSSHLLQVWWWKMEEGYYKILCLLLLLLFAVMVVLYSDCSRSHHQWGVDSMDRDILGMLTSPKSEELWIGEVRKRVGCGLRP